jgi:hypothetical protein
MKKNILIHILYFSILMILFGLIYEQIVFIPNYLVPNLKNASKLISDFQVFTNPIHYHAIPSVVAVIIILIIGLDKRISISHRATLLICMTIILVSTFYLVKFVNGYLFFNIQLQADQSLLKLAIKWSFINFIRIITLLIAFNNVQRLIIKKD